MKSETFGELIRRWREEKGWSLRRLAGQIDFDQSSLSKVERNELLAPARLVPQLAKVFGVSYKDLQIKYLSEKIFYELKDQDFALDAIERAQQRLESEGKGTNFQLQKEKLLEQVRQYLSDKPIDKAWLFGSFARSEESKDSDIDLLVRFVKPNKIDLFDYIGFRQELEELTGRRVDLVEEGYLIPAAEENVDKEKTLIYERKAG